MAVEVTPGASGRRAAQWRHHQPVGVYGGGRARQQSRPARRKGRGPRRDDPGRPACAARVHDHHRRLQRLPGRQWPVSAGHVGSDARGAAQARSQSRHASSATPPTRCSSPFARARASRCPGMMDTVLNLGLNDETVAGLATQTNNERFAWDAYRRFVRHVRAHRPGRPRREDRPRLRAGQGAGAVPIRTPTSTPSSCAP